MIVVRLVGGLGNQLFQYALGRNLAIKNNTVLKLDISSFENYKLRKYGLDHFSIVEDFASLNEIPDFLNMGGYKRKFYKLSNLLFSNIKYLAEEGTYFHEDILKLKGGFYLDGYWQSEKYFKEIEKEIRTDFVVKNSLVGKNLEVAKSIMQTESVCMHVRRGDYVNDEHTKSIYELCDYDYYKKGLELVFKKNQKLTLFVFSDDPDWVKKNMHFDFETIYVDHNSAENDFEDLRLMSLCKHNIIANSSFSWWGAWLNSNINKIVVSPKRWLRIDAINPRDINPSSWYTI